MDNVQAVQVFQIVSFVHNKINAHNATLDSTYPLRDLANNAHQVTVEYAQIMFVHNVTMDRSL